MVQATHPPWKFELHNHFKMVEDAGLKLIASRSHSMASPAYKISRKSSYNEHVMSYGRLNYQLP
jgi:hypothetical protein